MHIRALLAVAILAATTSCGDSGVERTVKSPLPGVNFVISHISGPALSLSTDRVYVLTDGDKKLIFEGYGTGEIDLTAYGTEAVIVAYCGGAIRRVDSFNIVDPRTDFVINIKVQPVVVSGFGIGGRKFCP